MDRDAIQRWVVMQHKAGRVLLSNVRSTTTEQHELGAIGDAFYDVSLGHPLHLIYSFEAMVRGGLAFSPEEIGRLPSCPEGDIRKYYAGLWRDLSPFAKQTIHAMAGSGFRWTEGGLRRCFGPIDEIDHLLEFQRFGVAPFHGSLLALRLGLPAGRDAKVGDNTGHCRRGGRKMGTHGGIGRQLDVLFV